MSDRFAQVESSYAEGTEEVWEARRGKWTLPILPEMLHGPVRLSQLKRKLPELRKRP